MIDRNLRLLMLGLDPPESDALRDRIDARVIAWEYIPEWELRGGELLIESKSGAGLRKVDAVVFHGIFEIDQDFDFLTALQLWRGPCMPSALGLLDCRLRLPCLARAAAVSRFGPAPRGFVVGGRPAQVERASVAKWGNWHCGENKVRISPSGETFVAPETVVIEPYFEGEAVRIVLVGEQAWQIRLEGEGWKKSIHDANAEFMPMDDALLEDTRRLSAHFGLEIVGVDYISGANGEHHLLEVNHVPNVTRFEVIREAFLEHAADWMKGLAQRG